VRLIAAALAAVALSAPALAQSSPGTSKDWEFGIAPYLWGAGIDGDVKIGRLPAQGVEASFSDLWDVLDIGGMLAFEGRKGTWGFFVDGIYLKFDDDAPAPNPNFGTVNAELTQQWYTAAATCRVIEHEKVALDVFAGTRFTDMDVDLSLSGGVASGRAVSRAADWWDGIAGGRVRYRPAEHWMIMGYLDAGLGGSKLTWQVAAGGAYVFNKTISVGAGYRLLDQDYEKSDFEYDTTVAGPYVGVRFAF
jgi:hypothetical protein